MTTKRLATNAMLAAMCAVLGLVSLDLSIMKFTFESFPIILGALLFGPVDGMCIAAIGTFLSQLFSYGIDASTILWIIPYVLYALVIGLARNKKKFWVILLSGILLTLLNTASLYLWNKWLGGSSEITLISFVIRIVTNIIKAVIFSIIIKVIWNSINKVLNNSHH